MASPGEGKLRTELPPQEEYRLLRGQKARLHILHPPPEADVGAKHP
jgi:hypothetical protein